MRFKFSAAAAHASACTTACAAGFYIRDDAKASKLQNLPQLFPTSDCKPIADPGGCAAVCAAGGAAGEWNRWKGGLCAPICA